MLLPPKQHQVQVIASLISSSIIGGDNFTPLMSTTHGRQRLFNGITVMEAPIPKGGKDSGGGKHDSLVQQFSPFQTMKLPVPSSEQQQRQRQMVASNANTGGGGGFLLPYENQQQQMSPPVRAATSVEYVSSFKAFFVRNPNSSFRSMDSALAQTCFSRRRAVRRQPPASS
jgi:hypothetical protein